MDSMQLGDLVLNKSARIDVIINLPMQVLINELPSRDICDLTGDDAELICPILGMDMNDSDCKESYIEFIQNTLMFNKRSGKPVPEWLVRAEIQIPHDLEKVGANDYTFSSAGWGALWTVYVCGNTLEECAHKVCAERDRMYAEVYAREQASSNVQN